MWQSLTDFIESFLPHLERSSDSEASKEGSSDNELQGPVANQINATEIIYNPLTPNMVGAPWGGLSITEVSQEERVQQAMLILDSNPIDATENYLASEPIHNSIPFDLLDPETESVMRYPITLSTGVVVERKTLFNILNRSEEHPLCPVTKTPLTPEDRLDLRENLRVKNKINEYIALNPGAKDAMEPEYDWQVLQQQLLTRQTTVPILPPAPPPNNSPVAALNNQRRPDRRGLDEDNWEEDKGMCASATCFCIVFIGFCTAIAIAIASAPALHMSVRYQIKTGPRRSIGFITDATNEHCSGSPSSQINANESFYIYRYHDSEIWYHCHYPILDFNNITTPYTLRTTAYSIGTIFNSNVSNPYGYEFSVEATKNPGFSWEPNGKFILWSSSNAETTTSSLLIKTNTEACISSFAISGSLLRQTYVEELMRLFADHPPCPNILKKLSWGESMKTGQAMFNEKRKTELPFNLPVVAYTSPK